MTVTWATWPVFFFTLLLLYATGVSAVPQLEPLNVDVLRGSEARFNISLSEAWYSMSWMLKNVLVLTINSDTGVSEHNRRFSVKNYSSADINCWEFIIRDVWRNDSGDVSCSVQEMPTQTAQLSVQESGTVRIVGGNMTVSQGQQAMFQCEAFDWFPKPTVSWVVDGKVMDHNSYNNSSEALDGLYNLTSLLNVIEFNSYQVKCLASISALTTPVSSSIYLAVGVSGVPQLEPPNVILLRDSEARFNISLSEAWCSMSWMLKNVLVLTINSDTGVSDHNRRFSVKNSSNADMYCWEFIYRDVWRNDSGDVSCGVQEKLTKTAQLSVQESGTVRIVGVNITVAQGHQAIFRCEAFGWFSKPTVSWVLDGVVVDKNSYNSSSEALDNLTNTISLLPVLGVNSVQVKCLASVSALTTPLSSSIYLAVETTVSPEPPDWTVLIAVVCSIGGFALLVLLILGIVFCCKRRKEAKSSYEKETGRTRSQIQMSGGAVGQRQGKDNPAYVIDGQTSVTHSEFNDIGYIQTNYTKHFEIPDLVNGNQATNGHANTLGGTGVRKHRHVTIV
uniref:Ig-like domain-containing protein n=1 Tax=Hucho hucho TaxID=62062 RepID=A0A4W5LP93_9TELE